MEVKKFKAISTEHSPEHFLGDFGVLDLKFRVLLSSTEILCEAWSDGCELFKIQQIKRSKDYEMESVEALLFHGKFKSFVEQQMELLMEAFQQDEATQKHYKQTFLLTHTEFEEYIVERFGVLKEKIKQKLEELEKMNQHVENTKTSEKEGEIVMTQDVFKLVSYGAGYELVLEWAMQDEVRMPERYGTIHIGALIDIDDKECYFIFYINLSSDGEIDIGVEWIDINYYKAISKYPTLWEDIQNNPDIQEMLQKSFELALEGLKEDDWQYYFNVIPLTPTGEKTEEFTRNSLLVLQQKYLDMSIPKTWYSVC